MPGLASYAAEFLMQDSVELDGDTLASLLLLLGPAHPVLRARLLGRWGAQLEARVAAGAAPEELEELLGDSDWELVLERERCDRLLRTASLPQAPLLLRRLGPALSQEALVQLAGRTGTEAPAELAELARPAAYARLGPLLPCALRVRLLQRLHEAGAEEEEEAEIGPWLERLVEGELEQLLPELLRLPRLLAAERPLACRAALRASTDEAFVRIFVAEDLSPDQLAEVFFDALGWRREACIQLVASAAPQVLQACSRRGTCTLGSVLSAPPPTFGQNRVPTGKWRTASVGGGRPLPMPEPSALCDHCGIVQGHLTTCSLFRVEFRPGDAEVKRGGAGRKAPERKKAVTARDALRSILSMDVFPKLDSLQSVVTHAVLSNLGEQDVLWLLDAGAPAESPAQQLFSTLECAVWRGYSAALISRLLPQKRSGLLPRNAAIGWNALHIALYQNHAHLLALLWEHFERAPYSAQIFTGVSIKVSVVNMME